MKYNFLKLNGEIVKTNNLKQFGENLGIKEYSYNSLNWEKINRFNVKYPISQEHFKFLGKYGLIPNTFNIACLQNLGMVYLFSNDLNRIERGLVK